MNRNDAGLKAQLVEEPRTSITRINNKSGKPDNIIYQYLSINRDVSMSQVWESALTIPIIMIIGIVAFLPYAFTDTYCCIVPYH